MKISEEIKQQIKEYSIFSLCSEFGIELKKSGKDYKGLCPFHEENEASFVVSSEKNLFNCFGCSSGGDVIEFIMKLKKLDFRGAVKVLAGKVNIEIEDKTILDNLSDIELLNHVADFYHRAFSKNQKAIKYLQKRKIYSDEVIKFFNIGFCNRSLAKILPKSVNLAGKSIRKRLQKVGILRSNNFEHLTGSVVFPIKDRNGQIKQLYGRKTAGDYNYHAGTPLHLYLAASKSGIFNLEGIKNQKEWIICESIIDALSFWVAGFRNVTCSFGADKKNPINEDLEKLFYEIKAHSNMRIILAFDNDEAGNKAAKRFFEKYKNSETQIFRANLPLNYDVNKLVCESKNEQKLLAKLLEEAVLMGNETINKQLINKTQTSNEDLNLSQNSNSQSSQNSILAANNKENNKPKFTEKGQDIFTVFGDRNYRIRNFYKNLSIASLKINLRVLLSEELYHLDNLDLCVAKNRDNFASQAGKELNIKSEIIANDLKKLLFHLEERQEKFIAKTLEPQKAEVKISQEDYQKALDYLKSPNLLKNILADFETCGMVGEKTNKLVSYLASITRKTDDPLAIIVQSSSAAGKTALMEAVLAFIPEEEKVQFSALTGQALFYMEKTQLKNKVLAIAEEEGAERASYALKLLQSEAKLSIASTSKDKNGNMLTKTYEIEGPTMIFLTTTAIDIDPELENRCIKLTVDESREQTKLIHQKQRQKYTMEGIFKQSNKRKILNLHQNCQRILKNYPVYNPYAKELTFLDDKTRTRRDHEKYLSLIASITLLFQYQRSLKTSNKNGKSIEYLETNLADIELANKLASEVLGRTLDELPPQTRNLLNKVYEFVKIECKNNDIKAEHFRFTQRQIREFTSWSQPQIKRHISKLIEYEYVIIHRATRGCSFEYELIYSGEGQNGNKFFMGLIDTEKLKKRSHNSKWDGQNDKWDGQKQSQHPSNTPQVYPKNPLGIGSENKDKSLNSNRLERLNDEITKKELLEKKNKSPVPVTI